MGCGERGRRAVAWQGSAGSAELRWGCDALVARLLSSCEPDVVCFDGNRADTSGGAFYLITTVPLLSGSRYHSSASRKPQTVDPAGPLARDQDCNRARIVMASRDAEGGTSHSVALRA